MKTSEASTRGFVCILGKREGKIPSGKWILKGRPALLIEYKGTESQHLEEEVSVFFVGVFCPDECLSMELCWPLSCGDGDRHHRSWLFYKLLSSKFSSTSTLSLWFLWGVLAWLHIAHEYLNIPSGLQTVPGDGLSEHRKHLCCFAPPWGMWADCIQLLGGKTKSVLACSLFLGCCLSPWSSSSSSPNPPHLCGKKSNLAFPEDA